MLFRRCCNPNIVVGKEIYTNRLRTILADGSEVALRRYICLIDWFGEDRILEVVANDGEHPLLGVALLVGYDLHISYRSGSITIE